MHHRTLRLTWALLAGGLLAGLAGPGPAFGDGAAGPPPEATGFSGTLIGTVLAPPDNDGLKLTIIKVTGFAMNNKCATSAEALTAAWAGRELAVQLLKNLPPLVAGDTVQVTVYLFQGQARSADGKATKVAAPPPPPVKSLPVTPPADAPPTKEPPPAARPPAGFQPGDAVSDEVLDEAIKRGIEYLWKYAEANPNGQANWEYLKAEDYRKELAEARVKPPRQQSALGIYGAPTYMVLMALRRAGVSPDDPRFQKAFKSVTEFAPCQTYAHALRAGFFSSLNKPESIPMLEQEKSWLLAARITEGGYTYFSATDKQAYKKPPGRASADLSNTQYGVLGMWFVSDCHSIEIPPKYWEWVQATYCKSQAADGGWAYRLPAERQSYQSMTLGALASLFIVWDHRFAAQCDQAPDAELTKSIDAGLGWLAKNFNAGEGAGKLGGAGSGYTLYSLYGAERVGVASGLKYFGDTNWWDVTARQVLTMQQADGSWGGDIDPPNPPVFTAWALLVLAYGRAPVMINKLKYGESADWNGRPRNLARLATWMGKTHEKLYNWQIMPIDRPVNELLDAPILLLSGKAALALTAPQKEKLRDFVLDGGLLLGEPLGENADKSAFAASYRALLKELFPELELKPLPPEHPLYNAQFKLKPGDQGTPPLEGLSNGVREFALLCPADVSCNWQRSSIASGRTSFELAANLLQYVSDKGAGLRARGVSYLDKDLGKRPSRVVRVGRLVWGNKYQSDPEPYAWTRLDIRLRNADVLSVSTTPCDFAKPVDAKALPVVHVTGSTALFLDAQQKQNLKQYVADGGLVLADAAGGGTPFAESFTKLCGELFGPLVPAEPAFLAEATDGGKAAMRHVDGLPKATRPIPLNGYQSKPGKWGVLLLSCDLTAALAGYANMAPSGLTPAAAEKFMAALLKSVAGR